MQRAITIIITLIGVCLFGVITVAAQEDATTPTPDGFSQTATALVQQASATAEAANDNSQSDDPFQLTGTALIVEATQLAQTTATPFPQSDDPFQMTATQLIINATGTAENLIAQGVYPESPPDDGNPLGSTLVVFGLLIFVLIGLGGGFVLLSSRNSHRSDKRKLG